MHKFVLTKQAVKDLSNIWNYTFDSWNEKQADKYYDEILKQCSTIAKNPEIGKSYSLLLDDLRGLKINNHIIFYRDLENSVIEVERILHERMDLKTKLED